MSWLSYSDPRTRAVYHRLPRRLQDAATTAYGWRLRRQVRGADYHRYRRLLDTSQWYDERQFADLQAALLSRFVRHAYAQVPHWRMVFDEAGLDPRSVAHVGDLSCLPLLTKAEVRRLGPELVAAGYKRRGACAVSMMTSGSTGTALEVIWSRECQQREYAFRDQHRAWMGAEDGARIVAFTPKALLPPRQNEPPFWRRSRAENRTFFSVHRMTEMSLPFYVEEVIRLRPQLVTGPPAALALFSRYLIANHLDGVTPIRANLTI